MTPFAIAGVQMHVSGLSENVTAMRHQIDVLMGIYPWVQMVLFSELAPYGPLPKNAQSLPNAAEEAFQESAARHGIWLIPGSMFEQVGEEIYNTASVINPAGEVVGRYRKMFPFYPYEHGISPGQDFLVFGFGLLIGIPLGCFFTWLLSVAFQTEFIRLPWIVTRANVVRAVLYSGLFAMISHAVVRLWARAQRWREQLAVKE